MARTRSKPTPKPKEPASEEALLSNTKPAPPSVSNPPKLFVLPKDTSKDARIVSLDNPANGTPSRYFFCPEKEFYEFTRIAAPKKDCRSWLIISEKSDENVAEKDGGEGDEASIGSGYIAKTADLFLATPIDILFLILPALVPKSAKETKQHFLELDDHLDTLSNSSHHWKVLLAQYPNLRAMIEKRMGALCDTVDAGDETMYRISHEKLLASLLKKAERMCKNGLPPSLENKFVKAALDLPIMNIKREASSLSTMTSTGTPATQDSQDSASTPATNGESRPSTTTSVDSQTTVETVSTTITSLEDDIPTNPSLATPPEVPHLLRLRTALTYLISAYLPPSLRITIQTLLKSNASLDFAPLDAHLAAIAALKAEAAALRSISDNISRKRALEEDEEKVAEREEKKRRKEEEEKKRKSETRGVKALKKVDTSGMKKLSSFFAKAPKKA